MCSKIYELLSKNISTKLHSIFYTITLHLAVQNVGVNLQRMVIGELTRKSYL